MSNDPADDRGGSDGDELRTPQRLLVGNGGLLSYVDLVGFAPNSGSVAGTRMTARSIATTQGSQDPVEYTRVSERGMHGARARTAGAVGLG